MRSDGPVLPDWLVARMVRAIRDNLSIPDRMLIHRALTERTERMHALFAPYGGLPVTDQEFAALMLRISKAALAVGGAS